MVARPEFTPLRPDPADREIFRFLQATAQGFCEGTSRSAWRDVPAAGGADASWPGFDERAGARLDARERRVWPAAPSLFFTGLIRGQDTVAGTSKQWGCLGWVRRLLALLGS